MTQQQTSSVLPPERAFVVQFSTAATPGLRRCEGRAEHVQSGAVVHFHSAAELLAFFRQALRHNGAPAPDGRGAGGQPDQAI